MDVQTVISSLESLDWEQLARVEAALKRRRKRLEANGLGGRAPVSDVLEYRPHADGYLQLEVRRYRRKDGSMKEHGPYWYFRYHEGGKQKTLYLGKTAAPKEALVQKRTPA